YYVHLSVTGRCNAKCAGCVNSSVTHYRENDSWLLSVNDTQPERDATAILKLLEGRNESEIVVSFYGGEPLLLPEKMESVVSILSERKHSYDFRYMVYTNGQLLGEAIEKHPNLMARMWLYSVSIDGDREQHNRTRRGTDLDVIHRNLAALRRVRTGPVLMWSTLREDQSLADCFDEFLFLHERGWVDHFFWHWVETDQPFRALGSYMERYERDLDRIMETYLAWLAGGKLLPVAHLNELVIYFLTGKARGSSACAVELARNFDLAGGKVHACADLPPEFAIGTIGDDGEPNLRSVSLSSLVHYKADMGCHECGVHGYCGGRCPVQALTSTAERLVDYCQLMRLHVGTVQRYIPQILRLLPSANLTPQDIYDESAFYAQFTDVTP
ncbi:MAG: radical SAM protein, partial [Chloroflexi bacterium]|nr:radical SAM protein [Chloroflexota bacterium]